jgi:hypothetical protein
MWRLLGMSTNGAIDIRTFPVLRAGDRGDWVAYLQRALAFHQDPTLPETGEFDRPTANALAAFQARLDVVPTVAHQVDADTWWHLTSPTSLLPEDPATVSWLVVAVGVAA